MRDLLETTIEIADANNRVLMDCKAWKHEVIVNNNLQIVEFTPELIKIKIKDYYANTNVFFKDFPLWEPVENKHKVAKVMWHKLVRSGTAKMYNEMVECLSEVSEWHSPDNGKTSWETKVLAHNAAIMYLSTKFPKNAKKEK